MATFTPGMVYTPVTPFTRDLKIDFGGFERLLEFHLRNGADSLAIQMHAGESVSLSDAEQRGLFDFTIKQVKGRVPVIAHVSDSGTAIAADRARYAQKAGAAAIVATSTYYWTPPAAMVLEHFTQIGAAVKIPYFMHYSPDEMGGKHHIGTEMVLTLIDRLPNFAGVIDASLDWQFMINIVSNAWRVRPDFQLLAGNEYMVSAGAVGATGMFTSLAGVAPNLVRELYKICRGEKYFEARKPQEDLVELLQIVKRAGSGGLKGALRAMGRDCGQPRPPLDSLSADGYAKLEAQLGGLTVLGAEPRGW